MAVHGPPCLGVLVGALALVVASCADHDEGAAAGSGHGRGGSPYWLAGSLPKHHRLIRAFSGPQGNSASYGPKNPRGDSDVRVTAQPGHVENLNCASYRTPHTRRSARGHPGCEYVETDEERPYGTVIVWQERADLTLTVEVTQPLQAEDARRIAEHLKTTDAATWRRLVKATTPSETLQRVDGKLVDQPDPSMRRVKVARGNVDASEWTLTALIPDGYPLGPEDHRDACAELSYRNETKSECASGPGHGSRFARLGGKVFAFGSVPSNVKRLSLQRVEEHGAIGSPTPTPEVATAKTAAAKPAPVRFFAAGLPDGTCGVDVVDASHPATRRVVGFAPALPYENMGFCTGVDTTRSPPTPSPTQPVPGAPITQAAMPAGA